MSAHAIDLLRRAHASLEATLGHLRGVVDHLEDSQERRKALALRRALGGSLGDLESIAGRVLMRTPVEPPRLSAECAELEEEPADLEDEQARTEALLPPAEVCRTPHPTWGHDGPHHHCPKCAWSPPIALERTHCEPCLARGAMALAETVADDKGERTGWDEVTP